LDIERRFRLHFHNSKLSSDGVLLPFRELDEAFGLPSSCQIGADGAHSGHKPVQIEIGDNSAGYRVLGFWD
jgi:hypothetical protein